MTIDKAIVPVRSVVPGTRQNYARTQDVLKVPDLIQIQLDSFRWFIEEGLRELFDRSPPSRISRAQGSNCASANTASAIPSTPRASAVCGT